MAYPMGPRRGPARDRRQPPGSRGTPAATWPRPALLVGVLTALVLPAALFAVHLVGVAFTLAGLTPLTAGAVLLGSLLGSAVNVPVGRVATGRSEVGYRIVRARGASWLVPVRVPGRTTVAVNLGGAVVPAAVSAYLLARTGLWVPALIAVTVVAAVVHLAARPVPGIGIALPPLLPAATAALIAIVLSSAHGTAALAYVAGTVGTLVGADLTNLPAIRRLGAPAVSIGGAGTFDGVFVTGVIAVLLAALP